MFYTIVTWYAENPWDMPPPPTDEQKQAAAEMTDILAPDFDSELTVAISEDLKTRVAVKSWPSEEIAQQWIDYTMVNFDSVSSAVISSTLPDLTNYQIHTQKII